MSYNNSNNKLNKFSENFNRNHSFIRKGNRSNNIPNQTFRNYSIRCLQPGHRQCNLYGYNLMEGISWRSLSFDITKSLPWSWTK